MDHRVALYSSAHSARHGGGVLYAAALGEALAQHASVDLFFKGEVREEELSSIMPMPLSTVRVRQQVRRSRFRSRLDEITSLMLQNAYSLSITQGTTIPRLTGRGAGFLVCEFPFQTQLLISDRFRLSRLQGIVTYSDFSAYWIERYWQTTAQVLYPPIFPITPAAKKPWILAVGRFLGSGRSKRQIDMIEMFRELRAQGLTEWELHLAGTTQDAAYVQAAMDLAADLPVKFHLNMSRYDLDKLYAQASIFWHAVGAGVDPEAMPGRMEHFGIVTGEAMSAGCVPIVINRGGQPEIVGQDGAGVLWESFEECAEATYALAHDEERRHAMADAARTRVERFTYPHFARRAQELFLRV